MKKTTIAPLLLFLVLSAILIICWFRFGLMYGGGDTGLPTYNPKVMAGIASNIWWDSLAPGIPVAQGLTSVPMLFLLSIPQILGAGPVLIQELLFFSLLFLMGYGMYLLALSIFGKSNYLMAIASGVFYMFNPYMMVQIWHRFIHNSMFFVSFVPFLVMSWLRWIRERKPISLLVFLLLNFLAVYIFGTIAFIVGFWLFLFLLTVLEGVIPWKGKKAMIELSLAFVIGLVFWLLTNSWWIIPTFNISPTLFAEQHTTNDSLATLMDLSAQTILPYTLRLINPFYLYWHADWGDIYQNIIFLSISWLFVLVVFIGFLKGLKQRQYVKWSLLFLIFIILGKGAAPPFGFPYIWGFSNFFPLGVIRNPFEKLGILLPLIYAILFAYGLKILMSYLNNRIGKGKASFILVVFIISNLAFLWPMFAGKLFGTLDKQNFVQVPPDYGLADNWIRKDLAGTKEGRILHLPLSRSESITYNWQNGYNGVEPSAALFTSLPSIARNLDIPKVSGAISALSLIFHKPYAKDPAVILKLLQDFSIKYIIIHNDVDWLKNELSNPREVEEVLAKLDFLEKKAIFGDLSLYKIKDNYFKPKITISDNMALLSFPKSSPEVTSFWPWVIVGPSDLISIVSSEDKQFSIKSQENLLVPRVTFNSSEASPSGFKTIFEVQKKAKYELLMSDAQTSDFYLNNLSSLKVSVNGQTNVFNSNKTGSILSFGPVELNPGLNEINYGPILSKDLLPDFDIWNKIGDVKRIDQSVFQMNSGDKGYAYVEGNLKEGVYSGGVLRVSLDILNSSEVLMFIQILQDSDLDEKSDHNGLKGAGVRDIPAIQYFKVNTMNNWRSISFALPTLRQTTQKARFRLIIISPYQATLFQSSGDVSIKNFKVQRLLSNALFLHSINTDNTPLTSAGEMLLEHENSSSQYTGKIKLSRPAWLIFKETFHPDWELKISDSQGEDIPESHYLAGSFANAWYVDKAGEYNFKISFKPQDNLNIGLFTLGFSIIVLLGYMFWTGVYNLNKKR